MQQIAVFFLLTVLSYFGVFYIHRIALQHQIMDHPNERSSHSIPMPLGGGLAIVILVLATSTWVINEIDWKRSLIYILSGSILAWMGWRDDVRSLPASFRLAVQSLVAVISMWGMGYFKVITLQPSGFLSLGIFGVIITFLWIVGMINAFNFIDGIDGMAGGVAFSAGLGWMWLAVNLKNPFAFWVALAIAASSLGFLGHNWSPAKIFMGDVASTFLGYSFAVLSLITADQRGDAVLIGTLLMWTVIMDTGATFVGRLIRGENIFSRHRAHLFQRLVISGYKHSTISALYMILTLLAAYLSRIWLRGGVIAPILIFAGLLLIWGLLNIYVARLRSTDTVPRQSEADPAAE
jgi:UDP-N-acetylmuramyl pentapeptide phosphotransferase/UDP-N-acetylglucosamine-1-phosphate transferase